MTKKPEISELIPIAEAARRLGVTRQRLDQLIDAYEIPVGWWYGRRFLTPSDFRRLPDAATRKKWHGVRFECRKETK